MGEQAFDKPVSRRIVLGTGAKTAAVVVGGLAVGGTLVVATVARVLEMREEEAAKKRQALMMFDGEEVYTSGSLTISESVNRRSMPYGPGTPDAERSQVLQAQREVQLTDALIVRRGLVNTEKQSSDLWALYWHPVEEKIFYVSLAAINDDGKYPIDINSLIPGKLNVKGPTNPELITLDNKRVSIGIDPK